MLHNLLLDSTILKTVGSWINFDGKEKVDGLKYLYIRTRVLKNISSSTSLREFCILNFSVLIFARRFYASSDFMSSENKIISNKC